MAAFEWSEWYLQEVLPFVLLFQDFVKRRTLLPLLDMRIVSCLRSHCEELKPKDEQ
jgi:hypothetical protein